jgi:hypothetical protein
VRADAKSKAWNINPEKSGERPRARKGLGSIRDARRRFALILSVAFRLGKAVASRHTPKVLGGWIGSAIR